MGPKCQNGPKKVPILPPSPKFLILPSDAAEKRRHIAVSHCCALIRHTQCIMCMYFMLSGPLLPTDHQIYFEMENVATTHFFALFARFLHFHENNDLKVPERSKNGPKKVPILSQRPKFCLCSDFSRQVPNPKSYIVAPGFGEITLFKSLLVKCRDLRALSHFGEMS